jgi:hypothetical protein
MIFAARKKKKAKAEPDLILKYQGFIQHPFM